jgi:outer membrane protein assembly factor BamB
MSENNLYVPAGRDNPVVYERVSGKRLRKLGGKGGTDVTMHGDTVFAGPGRTGQIGLVPPGQTKVFYTFFGKPSHQRTQMVVTPERFYLGGAGELRAMNHPEFLKQEKDRQQTSGRIGKLNEHIKNARRGKPTPKPLPDLEKELNKEKMHMEIVQANIKKCHQWKASSEFSDALILAGDTLFAGGDNVVTAHRVQDGREVWRHAVSGRALGLSVANGHLLVSTDQGVIHSFAAKSIQ